MIPTSIAETLLEGCSQSCQPEGFWTVGGNQVTANTASSKKLKQVLPQFPLCVSGACGVKRWLAMAKDSFLCCLLTPHRQTIKQLFSYLDVE